MARELWYARRLLGVVWRESYGFWRSIYPPSRNNDLPSPVNLFVARMTERMLNTNIFCTDDNTCAMIPLAYCAQVPVMSGSALECPSFASK
jgi:hypothetical protein